MFCDACTKTVFKFAKQPATDTPSVDPLCDACARQLNLWLSQEKVDNICSILNYLSTDSLQDLRQALRHITEKPTGGATLIPPKPQKVVRFLDVDQDLTPVRQHDLLDAKMEEAKAELANLAKHKQLLLDDMAEDGLFKRPQQSMQESSAAYPRPPTPMPRFEHIPGFTPAQSVLDSPVSMTTASNNFWSARNQSMECLDEMVEDDVYYSSDSTSNGSPCPSEVPVYSMTVRNANMVTDGPALDIDDVEEDCQLNERAETDSGYETSGSEQYDELAAIEAYLKTIKMEQKRKEGKLHVCPPSVAFTGPPVLPKGQRVDQPADVQAPDQAESENARPDKPGPLKLRFKACPNKPGAWRID